MLRPHASGGSMKEILPHHPAGMRFRL